VPTELRKLRQLLRKGLEETATLWPPVRAAYCYVRRAARLLKNEAGRSGGTLRRGLHRLLEEMGGAGRTQPELSGALDHFIKVSKSYEPGLFCCYEVADLPRTNNGLEQLFGSHRYHERRSSGRKVASPGLVVRGSVRLVAGVLTRLEEIGAEELAPADVTAWRELRQQLQRRQQVRIQGRRFRRDAGAYLRELEEKIPQSGLPS
jgi:hypothetical protein